LVSFLIFEFFIGTFNFKQLASVFAETDPTQLDSKGVNSYEGAQALPTNIQHNTVLEIVWTLIPCFILLLIAVPSFSLLYAIEDLNIIESTIKIIGNQ